MAAVSTSQLFLRGQGELDRASEGRGWRLRDLGA